VSILFITILTISLLIAYAYPFFNLIEKILPTKDENVFSLFFFIPIGYILTQTFYFYGHLWFDGTNNGIYFTLLLLICISPLSFFYKKSLNKAIIKRSLFDKEDLIFFALIPIIFIYINWPWLTIGEGNYYHSSNEDFYEGITGSEHYLTNNISAISTAYTTHIKFQYSSLAFWSTLFQKNGMYAFLFQSSLNLIMLSAGVFWLCKNVFCLPKVVNFLSAYGILASAFFFNTYLTGHIGSTIYVSYAPVYLGMIVLILQRRISLFWIIPAISISTFSTFTYPMAIRIIEIPFFILLFYHWVLKPFGLDQKLLKTITHNSVDTKKINFVPFSIFGLIIMLIVGIVFYYYWLIGANYRYLRVIGTDSWKIANYREIVPIFWGLLQPNLVGANSVRPFLIMIPVIYYTSYMLALIAICIYVFGGLKNLLIKKRHYLLFYSILFPLMAISYRIVLAIPYYFYKVLYVNYFLIVIAFIFGLYNLIISKHLALRCLAYTMSVIFLGLNLFWVGYHQVNILNRPYHNHEDIQNFMQFAKINKINTINFDITKDEDKAPIANIINEHSSLKIDLKSNHILKYTKKQSLFYDATMNETIEYTNDTLTLIKKNERTVGFDIRNAVYLIQDTDNGQQIFWSKIIQRDDTNHFKILGWRQFIRFKISNLNKNHKYLNFLLSTGPSIEFKNFPYQILLNDSLIKESVTSSQITTISIPIENQPSSIEIKIRTKGIFSKSIMPLNESRPSIAIAGIELSSHTASESYFINESIYFINQTLEGFKYKKITLKSFLNHIGNKTYSLSTVKNNSSTEVVLGDDWYPEEQNNAKEYFRRSEMLSTILIAKWNAKTDIKITMTLEPEVIGRLNYISIECPGYEIQYYSLKKRTRITLILKKRFLNKSENHIFLRSEKLKETKLFEVLVQDN